jgi:predicted double-glycine peptidase
LRGINNQGVVWLGDPSWGNRKLSENKFTSMWEVRNHETLKGKILLITPENESLAQINKNFFKSPELNRMAIKLLTYQR